MGMAVAMSGDPGFSAEYSWLMRLAIILARLVLPEPGIPLVAIINREVSGVVRSFAN